MNFLGNFGPLVSRKKDRDVGKGTPSTTPYVIPVFFNLVEIVILQGIRIYTNHENPCPYIPAYSPDRKRLPAGRTPDFKLDGGTATSFMYG